MSLVVADEESATSLLDLLLGEFGTWWCVDILHWACLVGVSATEAA